ncbi:hypothetical protein BJ085DRAFT_32569 [Dimargaris cristalligena]|uniref:Uncharacterized protein n=1 Tax=Dimargaris cristalligena TaxID=215637 RepID=A0A4P9ZYA5_9FUNG|nr:hypothetical protein BJ085DRAFT_32569 [Dimargaris cristalligena]|eukprot:RKP38657.1 hypothetical protein BJ085DRAFT_32569 [Dimargaris cristalligena]
MLVFSPLFGKLLFGGTFFLNYVGHGSSLPPRYFLSENRDTLGRLVSMDWDQDILSSGKPAWEGDPASRTAADGEESGDTSSLDNLFQKRVCLSIVDQGTTTSCQLTELHTIPAVFERLRKSGRVTQTDRSELWALVMQIRPSPDVVTYLHGLLSTLPWPQARYLLYQFIMGDGELPPAPAGRVAIRYNALAHLVLSSDSHLALDLDRPY